MILQECDIFRVIEIFILESRILDLCLDGLHTNIKIHHWKAEERRVINGQSRIQSLTE